MVRDLEQIKENEENHITTKKDKGNNAHHCKYQHEKEPIHAMSDYI